MEENIDKYSKKLFENYSMDKLPSDFTEKLMVKIEQEKVAAAQPKSLFSRKFVILFLVTFLSIFAISYFVGGTTERSETGKKIAEKIQLPEFDFSKLLQFLDFNIEISLFVKLFVVSIVVLVVIDLLSGSVIDYFIDSRTKKEG